MVNKAVAGVGTACVAAGAVISALVLTQENFVVVKLPGTESCSGEGENLALGQLSVVTASFNPQCTEGSSQSASFGQLKTIESGPILDFWPLFPAQALFGGNLGADDAGLEFTTCQEFYESNATLDFAKDLVVGRVTQGFPTLNATIAEGYQTATTTLKGGLNSVNTLLQGLWGSDIIPTVITGLDAGVTNNTQVQGLVTAGLAGLAQQLAVSLDQVLTDEKIGEIGAIAADDSSPLQLTAKVVAGGLVAGCNTAGTLQGTMAPFQAEGVKEAQIKEVVCWTNFFSQNVLVGESPEEVAAKEQLGGAVFVLNQCSDDTATVTSCGTDTNLANTLPQNLKGPWAFCIITASAENVLGLTLPTTGDCSAEYLLNAADLTPLVGDSPLAAQLPLFQALPSLCGDRELDECYLGGNPEEAAKGFPVLASFSAYSPMCLATSISLLREGAPLDSLPTCESFQDFLEITAATSPEAAAVIELYVKPCIGVASATEVADPFNNGLCDAFVAQAAATGESRTIYAVLGLNNLNVDGDSIEAIVASCEDDELDRAAISTAGTLLPISIASEGVAFLLAVGAVATNKRSLAMIASVLALLGAVLTVVALLGVQGAPVYASVGGDPVIGTPQYVQGLGTTLAYVAALAPLVGSIMLGGASCCQNEDPDEVALTSKVDNSY